MNYRSGKYTFDSSFLRTKRGNEQKREGRKDMETPPPLKNGQIFIKDAQCAETKEKSIFQFLVFEIWSI